MDLRDLLDFAGRIRYGMPTSEKERLAVTGALPGAPEDKTVDQTAANRYSSGFLFALEHPTLAAAIQPVVSQIKVSDLPILGGSSPELQSYADSGVQQGIAAYKHGKNLADLLR